MSGYTYRYSPKGWRWLRHPLELNGDWRCLSIHGRIQRFQGSASLHMRGNFIASFGTIDEAIAAADDIGALERFHESFGGRL